MAIKYAWLTGMVLNVINDALPIMMPLGVILAAVAIKVMHFETLVKNLDVI